MLRQNI